ncbi:MAG: Ig-like domain-containing protein [Candidatus Cloacimonetes bacterium]|nr:Ig-like domain-containing protein [Candidatus Cloacimonadota bacterium]
MNKNNILIVIIILSLILSCGKDKPPTGGPEDTTAPKIVDTEPANFTTNFSNDKVEFTFSEQIDLDSFKRAFNIYPLVDSLDYSWSPEKITVKFEENLHPDTLYRITISTECSDLRNNALKTPYTLTFSTGNKIPDFQIRGTINTDPRADEYEGNIFISLFSADSLLVSQAILSNELNYKFQNIEPRLYIISAFKDRNGNRVFNPKTEIRDRKQIVIEEPKEIINLTLTSIDEVPPKLKSINYTSSQYATILFNEDIDEYSNLKILEKNSGQKVDILDSMLHNDTLEIATTGIDTSTYQVFVTNIRDWKDNVTEVDSLEFKEKSLADTSEFSVVKYSPPDGATLDSLRPNLRLQFNKIVPIENVRVKLMNKENNQSLPLKLEKINSKTFTAIPEKYLRNYVPYQFIIEPDCMDYEGNKLGKRIVINLLPIIYQ